MELDKKQLVENVYLLAKRKNVQIGTLENVVGVSQGYFSRLKQPDKNDLKPSAELIVKTANFLDCSLETILFTNTQEMTETELFLLEILDKMIKETNDDSNSWISLSYIEFYNSEENKCSPLLYDHSNAFDEYYDFKFKSLFDKDTNYLLEGKIYKLTKNKDNFYLFHLSKKSDSEIDVFELYLYKPNEFKKICFGFSNDQTKLYLVLQSLYESISNSLKRIKIDSDVKKALDDYLSGDKKIQF